MHDPREIAFARYGLELGAALNIALYNIADTAGFWGFTLKTTLEGGARATDYAMSLRGKVETLSLELRTSETAIPESIQITIGHDAEWNPVVTVLSSKTDRVSLPVSRTVVADVPVIEAEVRRSLAIILGGN